MTRSRQLISLLLLWVLPAVGQFTYTIKDGTAGITGYDGAGGAVVIPTTINGIQVTRIEAQAFAALSKITSVTIPDGVTMIEESAFEGCTRLASLALPNSVTRIGYSAFGGCSGLTTVSLGTALNFIGEGAFAGCARLSSITIPKSVEFIGPFAFGFCDSLSAITVDPMNSNYRSEAGVLFNKALTTLLRFPQGVAGSYELPSDVSAVEDLAFDGCTHLTSITTGNSLTRIGLGAFRQCSSLSSVLLGRGVAIIGSQAFDSCTSLSTLTIPASVTKIDFLAFWNCSKLTSVVCLGNAPNADSNVFSDDSTTTVYYLPGTTGWGPTFGGRPALLWNPELKAIGTDVPAGANQFGFQISGSQGLVVVVEASVKLGEPAWTPLQTNTLTGAPVVFSDPAWAVFPSRNYRLRSP